MLATELTMQDGQLYYPGDEIPDLGSLRCVSESGGQRTYEGDPADELKLPSYAGDGSTALLYNGTTTKVLKCRDGVWYEL